MWAERGKTLNKGMGTDRVGEQKLYTSASVLDLQNRTDADLKAGDRCTGLGCALRYRMGKGRESTWDAPGTQFSLPRHLDFLLIPGSVCPEGDCKGM